MDPVHPLLVVVENQFSGYFGEAQALLLKDQQGLIYDVLVRRRYYDVLSYELPAYIKHSYARMACAV